MARAKAQMDPFPPESDGAVGDTAKRGATGVDAEPARDPRRLSRADNPLVRAVGRIPVRVRTKLLVASVGTVVLLVVVGVLGIRVLGQSNDRVERLGALQQRATTYRGFQTVAGQLRLLLALRAGGKKDVSNYVGGSPALNSRSLVSIDTTIASTLSQLIRLSSATSLGFVPPREDEDILGQIRSDSGQLAVVMKKITSLDKAAKANEGRQLQGAQAEPRATQLQILTGRLVSTTQSQTNALIAENRSAFADSQRLFIAVAAGSIVLALLLGFVLSWSLIGPIRRMETGLEAITAGDFSSHVSVDNRDELGALAANVNRMNDELGRLYKELETASQHKSEFLANMSHELRTPLNAIIGFSEVLGEQMFGELNEAQLGYVADVREAGQHLLSLINDILDLSKVEAGRMELELADVSLPQVLNSGLTMHGERATRGGITLTLEVDPDVGIVPADERKIRQVIFNLLSNAVKFTPSGGRVDVTARVTDGMIEVAVADTGPGIPPVDQERIFEEFQQVQGNLAGREGTGLGLTLSRRFIELHGGRLWVKSAPGAGSTFQFTLPISRPE